MTIEEFRQLHAARPFVPFTLNLADGRSVYVDHPEFAMQTRGGRTVHIARQEGWEIVDLLLVTSASVDGGGRGAERNGR